MYIWREKPRVKASTGNHCCVRSGRKPNPKVQSLCWIASARCLCSCRTGWGCCMNTNQHGPTSPWNQSQMQWTSMDPRDCNQRTQHPNAMTRSRSQDASSFFLLASWQPENTVNLCERFTGSKEAVIKSRFLLPMSRWLGGSLSSEEYSIHEKHVGHIIYITNNWHTLDETPRLLQLSSALIFLRHRPKKAGEELWSKEHTPNCPKHREPTDVHLAWEATCEGINRKSSHDMPRLQMCSCQCTQNGNCFVRSGRKPNPKVQSLCWMASARCLCSCRTGWGCCMNTEPAWTSQSVKAKSDAMDINGPTWLQPTHSTS